MRSIGRALADEAVEVFCVVACILFVFVFVVSVLFVVVCVSFVVVFVVSNSVLFTAVGLVVGLCCTGSEECIGSPVKEWEVSKEERIAISRPCNEQQSQHYTVGRFLNAWLNVCVSGKKGKLRV